MTMSTMKYETPPTVFAQIKYSCKIPISTKWTFDPVESNANLGLKMK